MHKPSVIIHIGGVNMCSIIQKRSASIDIIQSDKIGNCSGRSKNKTAQPDQQGWHHCPSATSVKKRTEMLARLRSCAAQSMK
mmetsp:Transcript_32883/g.54316  ORF Transcript_32883/g.54316 Transcript_32883/m.54316 type:complete len:82 (-) Transcript_32883:12-257(-)